MLYYNLASKNEGVLTFYPFLLQKNSDENTKIVQSIILPAINHYYSPFKLKSNNSNNNKT